MKLDMLYEPLLWPFILSLLGGIICLLIPKGGEILRGVFSVICSGFISIILWFPVVEILKHGHNYALYMPQLNLRIDAFSGILVLAVSLFGFLISLYSLSYMRFHERHKEYCGYLLWTIGISYGALIANNLISFLVFWGLLGLTLYVLVMIGDNNVSEAGKKTMLIIGGSDALLLLGIISLLPMKYDLNLDMLQSMPVEFNRILSYVAFLCFLSASFAKAGAMPFHTWIPEVGEKAPASVAAFLPASLDKLLGIYLLFRIVQIFSMNVWAKEFLMFIGSITILCGVMMAMVQHDFKKLLSYHAISQVGYMVLGIGTGTITGIAGGLFHMFNHAIYKSCLFLISGCVEKEAGTTDLDRLGDLARRMPLTFIGCLIAGLSISGIPPLNGFVSKWMVYQGIIETKASSFGLWVIWLIAAMAGSSLTLASFVKVFHAIFLTKPSCNVQSREVREVSFAMWGSVLILSFACIIFGVFAGKLPVKFIRFYLFPDLMFSGRWLGGITTVLMMTAYLVGVILVGILAKGKIKECNTYIGGEDLTKTYISGYDGRETVDVTGTGFYDTVKSVKVLKFLYDIAEKGFTDIYNIGKGMVFYFYRILSLMHSGYLPLYLSYFIIGFLLILWILLYGVRLL